MTNTELGRITWHLRLLPHPYRSVLASITRYKFALFVRRATNRSFPILNSSPPLLHEAWRRGFHIYALNVKSSENISFHTMPRSNPTLRAIN